MLYLWKHRTRTVSKVKKKNKTLKLVKKDNSDAFFVEQPEELAALLCLRLSWGLTSSPSGTCTRVVVYTSVASHSELPQTMPEATACTTQTQRENQKTMLVHSHPMCGIFTTNVKKAADENELRPETNVYQHQPQDGVQQKLTGGWKAKQWSRSVWTKWNKPWAGTYSSVGR